MADYNQTQFAAAVLDQLGIPQSRGALQALVGWEQAEGGHWKNSAKYNPLNTTLNLPGSGDTGSQGNISVYRDWNQGVEATVKTLKNGLYGGILHALKAGDPNAAARAIQASPWGTSGGLVLRTIASAKVPGSVNLPGASSMPAAGTPAPAAAGPSGSGQQAAPTFSDPGQGGNFTGLLGQLLGGGGQQQQAPQAQAVAPPQFAAHAAMPQGFQAATPGAAQFGQQSSGVSGALSLVQSLRGSDPASGQPSAADAPDAPQQPVAATVAQQRAEGKASNGLISPNARPGDPVVSGKQSVGGEHPTAGLDGYPAHDFFAPAGTHAVAPINGTVIRLSGHDPADGPTNGPHGPLGWSVYIRGSDGKTYYLTHMGSRTVKPGQTVAQGQVIGTVANYDKYGTPSHIHMGISG